MIAQITYYAGKGLILPSEERERELLGRWCFGGEAAFAGRALSGCQSSASPGWTMSKDRCGQAGGPCAQSEGLEVRAELWGARARGSGRNCKPRAGLHGHGAQSRLLLYNKEAAWPLEAGALLPRAPLADGCITSQSNTAAQPPGGTASSLLSTLQRQTRPGAQ